MSDAAGVCALIRTRRLIPVVRADDAEQAIRASEALVDGGLGVLEITLTVPGAFRCIEVLARKFGERVLVGAGTVLDAASCRDAISAGAEFIVTPGLRLDVVAAAREAKTAVLPGALTPTEVLAAWQAGGDLVKVFPCDAVGGAAYIKALRGPFPQIGLVPTGGVSLETAAKFLRAGATALGLGGSLIPLAEMRAGQWHSIRERAARLLAIEAAEALAVEQPVLP